MEQTRRNFIKTAAAAAGGLAVGTHSVVANGTVEDQYLVDTRSANSDAWREDVEIVEEAPELGFASVRGSESALAGLDYAAEIEYEVAPPGRPEEAPATENGDATDLAAQDVDAGDADIPGPHPLQWDKKAQGVAELHEQGITGEGARIGIVDGGIDPDHPDLSGNLREDLSENYSAAPSTGVPEGGYHGTHVAGIAAATGDSAADGGPYVVGMAPEAELVDKKVFPFKSSSSFLNAIRSAVDDGCDVVNMSFGPGSPYGPSVESHLNAEAYTRVGKYARDNGTLLVESAGNADVNIDATPELSTNTGKGSQPGYLSISATGPATVPSTIPDFGSVAPTTAPAYYTSYGPESVDLSSPGGNVLFTDFDGVLSTMPPENPGGFARIGDGEYGAYGTLHGTSMAAPNVTGVAALLAAENPDATPTQLKQTLESTARTIDEAPPDIFEAAGIPGIGYFESTNDTLFGDFELEDPYSSKTYRGSGHLDTVAAVSTGIPDAIEGGVDVMGETYYPADPDGDGKYEDVNGDGVVDMDDVELLYQMALRNVVPADTAAFDFNGDGTFDMYDVQALVRQVE
ncbi:S8 family serine peptidase [Halobacterium litoreum]|uniref:S8 family serine peptidase n=1 Tax=Halobacterium litoreum TaxID=2039234 RepID=A0ABD5NDZ8_9EURY|nr:S8 family serine peptidase [Halobacterium litoreum]UHH13711.1 S8 family serine peptidase [Halobacterium litoreum]